MKCLLFFVYCYDSFDVMMLPAVQWSVIFNTVVDFVTYITSWYVFRKHSKYTLCVSDRMVEIYKIEFIGNNVFLYVKNCDYLVF